VTDDYLRQMRTPSGTFVLENLNSGLRVLNRPSLTRMEWMMRSFSESGHSMRIESPEFSSPSGMCPSRIRLAMRGGIGMFFSICTFISFVLKVV